MAGSTRKSEYAPLREEAKEASPGLIVSLNDEYQSVTRELVAAAKRAVSDSNLGPDRHNKKITLIDQAAEATQSRLERRVNALDPRDTLKDYREQATDAKPPEEFRKAFKIADEELQHLILDLSKITEKTPKELNTIAHQIRSEKDPEIISKDVDNSHRITMQPLPLLPEQRKQLREENKESQWTTSHQKGIHDEGLSNSWQVTMETTSNAAAAVAPDAPAPLSSLRFTRGSLIAYGASYEGGNQPTGERHHEVIAMAMRAQRQVLGHMAVAVKKAEDASLLTQEDNSEEEKKDDAAEQQKDENPPTEVNEFYTQLISAGQIFGDAAKEALQRQFLDTLLVFDLMNAEDDLSIKMPEGDVVHVKANSTMMSLGVNFARTWRRGGVGDTLDAQNIRGFNTLIRQVSASIDDPSVQRQINSSVLRGFESDLTVAERIHNKACQAYSKALRLENKDDEYYKNLDSLESEIITAREAVFAAEKKIHAYHKAKHRSGKLTIDRRSQTDQNIIAMLNDARDLFYSGDWAKEENLFVLQTLVENITVALGNPASAGCKSNNDRV